MFPADSWGCGHYRLIWPAQALQSQGHDVDIVMPDMSSGIHGEYTTNRTVLDIHIEHDADVFVFQRPTNKVLAGVIKKLVSKGRTVVVDMDDDLSNINPKNPAFNFLHPKRDPHNNWHHAADACRAATLVTLSTPGLIDRYAKHGRYRILYNYVPEAYLKVDRPVTAGVPIWGWAGALHSHPDDLPLIGTTVQTLRDMGTFKILGYAKGTGRALGLSEDPPASGKVEFEDWPTTLSELSLGVAPLADTRFNTAKSWLKPLEYSALGIPWVASPSAEYERLAKQGPGGVIARRNRPKEWTKHVRALLQNEQERAELGEAARDTAGKLTVEGNAWRWAEAWAEA